MGMGNYLNFGSSTISKYTNGSMSSTIDIGKYIIPVSSTTFRTTTNYYYKAGMTYLTTTSEVFDEYISSSKLKMAGCMYVKMNNDTFFLPLTDVSTRVGTIYNGGYYMGTINYPDFKVKCKGSNLYPLGTVTQFYSTINNYINFSSLKDGYSNSTVWKLYALNASVRCSFAAKHIDKRNEYTYYYTRGQTIPAKGSESHENIQKASGTSTIYVTNSNLKISTTLAWYIPDQKISSETRSTFTDLATYTTKRKSYSVVITSSKFTHVQNNWGWGSVQGATGSWSGIRTNKGTKSGYSESQNFTRTIASDAADPYKNSNPANAQGQTTVNVAYYTTSRTNWSYASKAQDSGSSIVSGKGVPWVGKSTYSSSESHTRRITVNMKAKTSNAGVRTKTVNASTEKQYTWSAAGTSYTSGYITLISTSSSGGYPITKVITRATSHSYSSTNSIVITSYYHNFKTV